jgi:hypothetical protein
LVSSISSTLSKSSASSSLIVPLLHRHSLRRSPPNPLSGLVGDPGITEAQVAANIFGRGKTDCVTGRPARHRAFARRSRTRCGRFCSVAPLAGRMIYDYPAPDQPIRQGDIFSGIPKPSISLGRLSVVTRQDETVAAEWNELRTTTEPIAAIVGLVPVVAIVATQDCDTIHAPDLSLCEVKRFSELFPGNPPATPKGWVNMIKQQTTRNLKWLYLPPDERMGFADRRVVDFQSILRVARDELEQRRHLRLGRLNDVADEHFRERLAEFFRRYPYNEWYPFTKEEFDAYKADYPDDARVFPYDYQK